MAIQPPPINFLENIQNLIQHIVSYIQPTNSETSFCFDRPGHIHLSIIIQIRYEFRFAYDVTAVLSWHMGNKLLLSSV